MLNIYLIRHGQNVDNVAGILNGHRDGELTPKGVEQAREIATKIKESGIKFDAIYSSPLRRAFETAKIISEVDNFPKPQIEPLLIERNFGAMTGQKIADIEKLCSPNIVKAEIITYFTHSEGAETFPDLMARGGELLAKFRKAHSSGNILLVTHGDIGKMIYAKYHNLDWRETLTKFHFGNCDLILLSKDSNLDSPHVFKTKQHNH